MDIFGDTAHMAEEELIDLKRDSFDVTEVSLKESPPRRLSDGAALVTSLLGSIRQSRRLSA